MSRKQSSFFFQQQYWSTGSNDSLLNIGRHKWLRLIGLVFLLYLAFLPIWWAALEPLTALAAACADLIYHFLDSSVSIAADGRIARITLDAGAMAGKHLQESGLRMETVAYGMPLLAALVVATRPARLLGKLQALAAGLALMTLLTVLAIAAWARLVGLETHDQMVFATTGTKGHTSAFMYYCFHGYAFSQPVLAVITWMGTAMCGFFDVRPLKDANVRTQEVRTQEPKSRCWCGSGRQFRRCCGKTTRK